MARVGNLWRSGVGRVVNWLQCIKSEQIVLPTPYITVTQFKIWQPVVVTFQLETLVLLLKRSMFKLNRKENTIINIMFSVAVFWQLENTSNAQDVYDELNK